MMKRSAGSLSSSLQDPRPQPLSLPPAASRPSKRPRVNGGGEDDDADAAGMRPAAAGPVIVYEHTPRVVHARPDEFKALVQRLTGREQPVVVQPAAETSTTTSSLQGVKVKAATTTATDSLVLTLGQAPPPPPLDDYYTPPALGLPSPAAGFLLSPGSFLFSPATMKALQELIS